jgi:DNA polymerase III alpha subunit (gram-positive type)
MQVANIIVWDLETGGLSADKYALAEIAMIAYDSETLEEVDRYEAIIAPYSIPVPKVNEHGFALDKQGILCAIANTKPDFDYIPAEYHPRALEVNGLTMRQINAGKEGKVVAKEILDFCKKHSKKLRGGVGKPIPAGHNLFSFDIPYLTAFLSYFNIEYTDCFQGWCIDTLWLTRLRWPQDGEIVNHKLPTACEKAGVELIDAHRAMNDTEGNGRLLKKFISSMRENNGGVEIKEEVKHRDSFKF